MSLENSYADTWAREHYMHVNKNRNVYQLAFLKEKRSYCIAQFKKKLCHCIFWAKKAKVTGVGISITPVGLGNSLLLSLKLPQAQLGELHLNKILSQEMPTFLTISFHEIVLTRANCDVQ